VEGILRVSAALIDTYRTADGWSNLNVLAIAGTDDCSSPVANGTAGSLFWKLCLDGTLTISGTGAMPDYDATLTDDDWVPTHPWSMRRNSITAVVIENGVTSIGNFAFYGCRNLMFITIPHSVTKIGEMAFVGSWYGNKNY
jgi:hypothetical protein